MNPLGITMGCPVGIGPEILLRFFSEHAGDKAWNCVVIGDLGVLQAQAHHFGIRKPCIPWTPGEIVPPEGIPVLSVSDLSESNLQWGTPTAATGHAMGNAIKTATELALSKTLSGIVTCPITKGALQSGGYNVPGHTEMLAAICGERHFTMMLAGSRLRVTLVTIHCGLKDVVPALQPDTIFECISLTAEALQRDFAIPAPRIAVAGVNPHAGENGLFGSEEKRLIAPAITKARERGIELSGPFPPDTIFYQAASGKYDAVVCMYHDQGLIPFKLLHFADGVNVTLGLPVVRTSVDHGTAYDIAGSGRASCSSLTAAVDMARTIAANRAEFDAQKKSHIRKTDDS